MMNKDFNAGASRTVGRPRSHREAVTVRLDRGDLKWIDERGLRLRTGRSDVVRWAISIARKFEHEMDQSDAN